jgi:hypothetical protein
MMNSRREPETHLKLVLTDDDKDHIRGIFLQEIVPRLVKLHARLGNICCDFAGPEYRKWTVQFTSRGEDFEIVDFEYDEDGVGIDLDL